MKSFNFSKKFEQVTSLVLAIMLLLSVFTASNVAVFADSNNKSTKTKNSDSEVNLYVKSDVQPFIKSSSDSEYKIISKTNAEDDYYSAKVKKSSSASTADTANITYRLANFSVDNNKVYFIKPSNWNIDNYKIYAYVWDGANNFTKEMSVVKSTEKNNFYCEENNTLSHLNNADKNELYYADFSNNSNYKNYKNILFFANETGVVENNPQMKTDDFELNYGSVYFGNDKNYACKTIGNIKEVGSQFTATDDMIVSVQDNNISILKESDLNIDIVDSYHRVQLRNGIQISFWKYKSDVHFECSKYDTEKFGELTYYYTENNVEKIIDGGKLSEIIKNNDVNVIVKLGNIPLKIYTNVKVNTGLTIDSIKWNYKTNVNSHISGNNVYVPSSCEKFELAVDSLEITGAKLNGEKLEGEALKGINIIDKNISNSQTVYQKDKVENTVENTFECQIKEVKYLGETYKYPINDLYNFNFTDTVNSHFVDVSVTVDDNYGKYAFIDSENNYIYQNGSEKCKYIVTPTSNDIKTDEITVISNSGKISYEKGIITVQQGLTEDTEFTVKYPHEDGFEVKTYTIKPDNDAPEIESIVFTKKENDTLKNYGLYSSDEIEFKITIKDKDNVNVAGVDNEALSCADDYFEINPPEYNETDKTITYTCILNKSITSSDNKIFNKIFKVKDKVSNSAEYSLSDLIDKNNTKVSVGDEEIINESFEVVSNSNDKNIEVKNTFNGDNYDDEKHIIGSGKEVSVTSVISDKLSGINNIGNFKCTYSDGTSVNITDVSGKDLSGVDTVAYSYVDNGETTKTTEVELKYTIKTENSGKYELSYTVTNNSGVKKDVSETFYVDNTAPNVTNVDFVKTSNPSVSDQILNFLTFGIYSNDTIVMKVTATDSAPTSGFDKIDDAIEVVDGNGIKIEKADSSNATKNGEVTNTAASNATQESNVTYSFELGNSDDLSFTVKDNANNVNENIALADLVKDNKVKANDNSLTEEQLKNVSNVFEVVSSTKKPTAEVSSYNATGTKAFNDNNIYHGDQLTVTLNLNNDISGLQSISDLSVRGFESSNFSNFKLTKINGKDQSFSANSFDELAAEFKNQATNEKVKSATVTFDINIKDNPNYSESHKLSLTVTDNIGNVNTEVVNSTFYVDNTAPKITKVEFVKTTNPTVTDQILNFLTFGIYSNDTIVMNVTALDNAPTSGLPSDSAITVKNDNKENLDVKEINDEKLAASATENSTVTYSYNLDKLYNAYKLSFTVKDNDGNTEKDIDLITLIKNKKVIVNGYTLREEQLDDISKSFEVLLTNKNDLSVATNINGINYGDDSNIIVSGAETKVESTVNLGEDLTGAGSIGNFRCAYYQDPAAEITSTPTSYVTITHNNNDFTSTDVHQSYVSMDRVTKDQELKFDYVVSTEKSGKYVLTYTVINNAGVEKTVDKTFYVDNTAPEITKVEFVKTTNPTVTDQILNFLTFGIYSNDTIVMNVTALDNAPTSGLPSDSAITVKNDNKENLDVKEIKDEKLASNATESSTVTYSYNLGNSDSAYNLSFTVKDKANNVNENIALADLVKDNKVKANDNSLTEEQLKNVSNVFEVVSSTKKPTAEVSSYNATGTKAFNDNNIYHGDQLTVTLNLNNDISGLQSISDLSVRGFESSNFSNFKLTKINGKDQSFSANSFDELAAEFKNQATNEKVKSATVTFDINIKDNPNYSESHKLSLTVTDNIGNVNTEVVNSTFYVDNTAPKITKVEFVKTTNPTVTDQILNFLTFGIYSNDTIVMNVTALDNAPTSGLPSDSAITVKNDNKENLDVKEKKDEKLASNATDSSTVTYSYNLGNSDSAYVLSFTVKDNAGNTATKSLVDLIKEDKEKTEKVVVANANITKVDYDKIEGFEVVSNNDSTKIDAKNTFEGTNFDDNSNPIIRSGDTVSVVSNIKDQFTGINKIGGFSCKWNDSENVKITDNDNNLLSSETFSYDYVTDKKTTDVTLNYNISTKESGKYVLTYTVTNNAGVKKTFDETFYVDNTAPVIRDFTFENGKTAENPDSVIKTEYGYYFKNTTTVEVTAVDGEVDSLVSGVSEIHFYTIEKGKTAPSNIQEVLVSGYNQTSYKATTFEVPANFKGNVYAYAVDKAGNCYNFDTTTNKNDSQPVTPDRVVVENSSKHEQMSGIDISLPATNYVENSNKLYNNDVNVALNVSDTYSGIAKIEYSVSSEFDKDNNWDGSIKYLNDQSAETNMNGNGTVSGWKIEESDQNLVTKASSTITVKNNSNNIKIEVKLTDRAGNVSTKKETLSIDKTKPTIKIEYDNNNHTTHNGTEFYKANRTATITVTERNFSPEDVISKITNADNVITQITGWTTHNVANGENPDGTTHTATVVYASDGDYTFDIAFTDMAGNKADKVAQHKFTIDKTIPVISVSFDNNSAKNNNYFKADRTATITVNEHNFNAADVKVNISATGADNSTSATAPSVSSWTNNGNVHTATISFAKDGKYAFDVNYTDLADNAAKENVVTTFYVDKTAPTVKISNVVNESANSGNVAPVISLSDNNYSGDYVLSLTRVDINAKKTDVTNDFASTVAPTNNIGAVVTYANFASEEVNDGIYVLNATLTDKAGNSSADTITFSVNRFGSTYMGGDEETNALLDNGYTNAEKDIVISEINVDKLTKSNISLSLDSSSLKTLKQNVDYTIQEDTKTGQWHRYNYTVKSSNFENEGNYTLELSSTDAAKNTSTNRIRPVEKRKLAVQFVVDKTSPVVNIAGIENNALYEENSKDVTIVCEDSYINPSSLVINLDNKTLKEGKDYTVEKDVASITAKIKVNATSDISSQNIKVSVKDMAQNSGDGSVENFTLSATVLMRFFANPVLVIISAVILAGIIVMVVLIVAKKRKNN